MGASSDLHPLHVSFLVRPATAVRNVPTSAPLHVPRAPAAASASTPQPPQIRRYLDRAAGLNTACSMAPAWARFAGGGTKLAWLRGFRRLRVRTERRADVRQAILSLAPLDHLACENSF
jgi:hypothetical protein